MASKKIKTFDPKNWVDLYGDFLFRFAYARVNDRTLAEDLVQETFLAALKSQSNFDGKSSERTWFISILKHKIIDQYRKSSRRKEHEVTEAEGFDPADDFKTGGILRGHWNKERGPSDWGEHPEDAISQKEFMRILRECISLLPAKMAAVFSMREIDEINSDDICKELKITSSNLWVLLHRARAQLRHCLEFNWFEKKTKKDK
ncbi:MAG: sigma-70 family RNA polymerase sigma factor [Calditrichaceae bacterium]